MVSCGGVQENESPADSQMVAENMTPVRSLGQQLVTDTLQGDDDFAANAMGSAEETIALANLAIRKSTRPEVKNDRAGHI